MKLWQLLSLAYSLGIVPWAIWFLRKIDQEIADGTSPNFYAMWPRRNIAAIAITFGFLWPLLLVCYLVARVIIRALWQKGPPDDPDGPQEETS